MSVIMKSIYVAEWTFVLSIKSDGLLPPAAAMS